MTEQEMFAAAIRMSPDQRDAFLAEACGGDQELLGQVAALLQAHDASGGILHRNMDEALADTQHIATEALVGSVVAGRYKLIEVIGEGGMGSVWLAEQREPVRRKVAIKLIKAGMDSRAVLARFEAERQALAMMDHPHIAKVHDGGVTEQGRPFFAMELVRGIPLTDYCDQTQLSVRERLELFSQVGSAIQHAHQKGIIHRDLKPSNILVTEHDGKPVAKVIDFGLAKALHGSQTLTDLSMHTAFGAVLGTPLYMAPEQLGTSALDVDTRADLYSLGVLLYELLTGTTPIERERMKEAAWEEIRRMVREEDPPRPSARLSTSHSLPSLAARRHAEPGRLTKLIRGDLDWIIMKTLEKDRNRRYGTASDLVMDIQRYLDGEAVLAAPPSRGYRLRKAIRRHRGPLAAAAVVLIVLIGGIAGTSYGMLQARQAAAAERQARIEAQASQRDALEQRARAEQREREAIDAVKRFGDAVTDHPELRNNPQLESLRKSLLKEPLSYFQRLRTQLQADRDTRPESLERLADVMKSLSALNLAVGDRQVALEIKAEELAIRERLAKGRPETHEFALRLADASHSYGDLCNRVGRPNDAFTYIRRAIAILEQLSRHEHDNGAIRAAKARVLLSLAQLHYESGQAALAMDYVHQAKSHLEPLTEDRLLGSDALFDLAVCHKNLAMLLGNQGKFEEAVVESERARAIQVRLVSNSPGDTIAQLGLIAADDSLGSALLGAGKNLEAREAFERARGKLEELANLSPATFEMQSHLAGLNSGLGITFYNEGQWPEAREHWERTVTCLERLARDHPTVVKYYHSLATALGNLAILDNAEGHFEAARERLVRALANDDRAYQTNPHHREYRDRQRSHWNELATAAAGLNDAKLANEARDALRRLDEGDIVILLQGLPEQEKSLGPRHAETLATVSALCDAYERCDRFSESLALAMEHGFIFRASNTVRQVDDAALDRFMAQALNYDARQLTEALDLGVLGELQLVAGDALQSEQTLRAAFGATDDPERWLHKALGISLHAQGKVADARQAFEAALERLRSDGGRFDLTKADHLDLASAYFLHLVSEADFAAATANDVELACYPWFYIGQRLEHEGKPVKAMEAYRKSVDLAASPQAEKTGVLSKYRLKQLAPPPQKMP